MAAKRKKNEQREKRRNGKGCDGEASHYYFRIMFSPMLDASGSVPFFRRFEKGRVKLLYATRKLKFEKLFLA